MTSLSIVEAWWGNDKDVGGGAEMVQGCAWSCKETGDGGLNRKVETSVNRATKEDLRNQESAYEPAEQQSGISTDVHGHH